MKHRKLLEEDVQKDFAIVKRQLFEEKERLLHLEREKDRISRELQEKQTKSMNVSDVLLYADFIQQASREIEKQSAKVLETEKNVEQKREELVGAMKSRKAIDRLREKGFQSHLQDLTKKEQDLMNETAINVFNKR